MKAILIQQAVGEPYEGVLRKVDPWHRSYCKRHGIEYLCHLGRPPRHRVDRHPAWDCMPLIQDALESDFELVVWLDVDALIVRDVDLREVTTEFENIGAVHHPMDFYKGDGRGHLNVGALYIRNTELSRKLIWDADALGQIENRYKWYEQASMLEINEQLGAMTPIHDRWNATFEVNECPAPVVRAWHGRGKPGLLKLERVLEGLLRRKAH
jgi:hypothetical protein